MAARTAMMAMTTTSSIRVKAEIWRWAPALRGISIVLSSLCGVVNVLEDVAGFIGSLSNDQVTEFESFEELLADLLIWC
jgi:hypothetical protein